MTTARRNDTRIELLRVIGALCVFSYHFMGDAESVLLPTLGPAPLWDAIRDGSGPFGVALFIILSGLVFTWAWPRASSWAEFVRRRLAALFPLYWWIAVPLIALALLAHRMPTTNLWKVPFWLSGLGIVSRETFFPVVAGWWYMTIALQLVLAYPVLRRMQERLGLEVFVLGCAVVTVASVWALTNLGLYYAISGFVGSRLLEFAVGMTIGKYLRAGTRGWPRASVLAAVTLALAVCVASPGISLRSALAPVVVLLTVGIAGNVSGSFGRWVNVGGSLSFAFYLSHSPWAKPILSSVARMGSPEIGIALGGAMSLTAAVLIAWGFQSSFLWVSSSLRLKSSRAEQ